MKNKRKKLDERVKKSAVNNQWMRNVLKSMGYTSVDLVRDLLPSTGNFVIDNRDNMMNLAQGIRSNMSPRRLINNQFKNLPQVKAMDEFMKNMKDDLRTGNFNNVDREMQFDDSGMDFGFGSFDDDDMFGGTLEFVEEDDGGNGGGGTPTFIDTMPLARAINSSTEATVGAIVTAANQQMALDNEKMIFDTRAYNAMLSGMNDINDNLATLVKFNAESTAKYHAASMQFYEEALELIKSRDKKQEDMEIKNSINDLFDSRGNIRMQDYLGHVKGNIGKMKDESLELSMIFDNVLDPANMALMAKNPIGYLTKLSFGKIVPAMTRASLKSLDDALSAVFPALLAKINTFEDSENVIEDYLYKVFGAKEKYERYVDLDRYEKGAIQWDGEAKKALVEVIPTYLRRIESALTGQQERIYDYDKGVFTDIKKVKENFDKKVRETETSGYLGTKLKAREVLSEMGGNFELMKQFDEMMEEYFSTMTRKGHRINPFKYRDKDGMEIDELFEELGWDYEKTDLFRKVFSGLSMNDLVNMANSELNESRAASQKLYDSIRKDPNKYGYSTLKNGGYYNEDGKLTYIPSNSFLPKDRFGLSQLDYLRDIRRALIHGIIVYPEYNHGKIRPNADLLRKEFNEYVEYDRAREQARRAKEEEERFSSSSFMDPSNMSDVLDLSDDKVKEAYDKVNGKAKGKKGKISKIVDPVTDKVNAEVFKILFGGRYKEDMDEDDIEDAAGVTSDGKPKKPRPGGSSSGVGSIMDFFSDTIKGVGAFFTGQGYTKADGTTVQPSETGGVMGKLKGWFSGTVDKLTKGEDGGVLGKITADFMEGFGKFKVSLFGEAGVGEHQESIQELTKKIKERAPKAIGSGIKTAIFKTAFASQLGALGSIILPGGPLGAALIGMTTSFLRQSETFNKWLFGEKAEDGTRMGGIIPQSLIDMVEKHGGAMKKGGIIGGVVGLLPSFFLPGGPVTGAILGTTAGFISKSDAFQEFLYGENFGDKDNRSLMNGKLGQLFKKMFKRGKDSDVDPKLATFLGGTGMMAGIAQGVGLLPSFLLPGGPIMGAVLGLAGGIAASSEKFQKFLFGEKEVDGKRYGGLLTKVTNWFDTSVMTPIKIRMQEMNDKLYEFLQRKIIFPIQDAFAPIKQAGKFMLTDIKNSILDGIHSITNPITDAFKESFLKPLYEKMKKVLIDPLARKIKGVFGMMGKLIGKIITMPISLLTGVGKMADRYNKRHVIRDEKRRRREEFRNTIHGEGYDSVGGFFKGMRQAMYMTGQEKDAIIGEKLPYTNPEEKAKREEELQAKMAERAAKREEMQKQFEEDMKFGKNSGWKWASEKQKKKHEEELKKKEQWMREKQTQDLSEVNETTKAHKSVSEQILDVLKRIGNIVDDKLKDAANKMNEGVENAKEKAGNLKEKAEATAQNVKAVVEDLRAKGQSHAEGLDEVPEDGYLAELHEGEMVVPKKPAGFLRNMFGKGMKGITNMFSKAIDVADDEEEEEERKDREDNDEGLTDLEMIQEEGKRRKERYKHVSRKNADSVLKERAEEAKAKEEKAWRNSILDAIHSLGGKLGAGASKGIDLLSGIGKMLGNIPNSLMGILKALGITGALAALTQVVGGAAINEYSDIANENNDSLIDVMEGEHRVERLDADGTYVYDNQAISMGQKLIRPNTWKTLLKPEMVLYDKVGKPLVEGAKTAIDKGKVIGGKVVDYFNPNITKTGTTVLGDTYTYTMRNPDATMGGKIMGKVADVAGTVKSKAKSLFDEFISMCKKALNVVMNKMVEKFPKLKTSTIVNSLDEIVPNLVKNADNVIAKFGKKIAVFIGDVALDVVPVVGQVTEACCTIYDVLSGLTAGNTGNMFGVPESHVDNEMRIICSVLQGLCKFSAMAVIWLLNEITTSFMGLDFIQWLARLIYTHLPVNLGTKVDVTDQLSGVNIDSMSMEDVLSKAGITEAGKTILFNPDGTMKDWSTLNVTPEQLKDTGISSAEFQNIARHQYNLANGTQLDEAAWNDKMNKTLGMKIMDSDFGKRLRGITQAENLGLDSTANVTLLDRFMNDSVTKGTTFMNAIGKMTGNEKLQNMTVKDNWLMKKYANWRNTRYQNKITKGEAEIAERQAKEEAGKGGWWNRLQLGWENWKLGKNKGKLGIPEEGVLTTEEIRQKQLNGEKVEVRTGANGKYGMGTILGSMNLNGLNSTQEQQAYDQYRLLSEQGVNMPGVSFDSYGNMTTGSAGFGDGEEFDPEEQKIVEVFNEDGTLSHCITVPVKTTTEVEGFSSKDILKPVVEYNNSKMQSIPQYDEKGNIVSYTTMDKRKTKTGGLFSKITSAVGGLFGLGSSNSSSSMSTDNSVDNSSNVTNNTGDTYNTTNEIDTTPFQPLTEAINSLVNINKEENVDADGNVKTGRLLDAILHPISYFNKQLVNAGVNVVESVTGEEVEPEKINKAINFLNIIRNPLGYLADITKGYLEGNEEDVNAVNTAKEKTKEAFVNGKNWAEGKLSSVKEWGKEKIDAGKEWFDKEKQRSYETAAIMAGDKNAKANVLSTGVSNAGKLSAGIYNLFAGEGNEITSGEMTDAIATFINKAIVTPFKELANPAADKFNEVKDSISDWVTEKKENIANWYTEEFKPGLEKSKESAKKTQQAIIDDVNATKERISDWYTENIGKPLEKSTASAKKTQQAILDDVKARKDAVMDWYTENIGKPLEKSTASAKKTQQAILDDVKARKDAVMDWITKEFKKKVDNIKKTGEAISDWVQGFKDKIVELFNKYLKDPVSDALSPVTSAISGAWSSFKSAFEPFAKVFDAIKGGGSITDIIKSFGQEGRENAGLSGIEGSGSTRDIRPKKYRATESDFITPTNNTTNNTTNSNTNNKFVFYNQSDSRWAQNKLGNKKMKDSGCGPTSLAMAISQLTGEQITPDTIARLGKEHLPGFSKYSLFPSVAEKLNMNYNEGYDEKFIINNLQQGIPVILSGRTDSNGTPYTSEGHVVTATKIKGDSIFINDPRGKEYSGYYPISSILKGLNKGMTVSPSNRTDVKGLSSGQLLNGWNGKEYEDLNGNALGIFGDAGEYKQLGDISGGTGATQITMADRVLSYARAFLNNTSKFSYSQPRRLQIDTNKSSSKGCGADCSSFVSHVLSRAGDVDIYGTTSQTFWDSVGTKVDEPQIGDVVCQQGHVGLYSGDGNYIHMSGRKAGIKESKAIQNGNNKHRGYKRVLKNPSQLVDPTVPNANTFLGTVVGTPSGQPVNGATSGPQASLDKALLIGDSLTVGIKSTLEGKYPNAHAMGKGGKWATQWLNSLDELPDPESVSTVIQWLGINGVHNNKVNLRDSQELLNKLKEKYAGKPIFNMDIFPTTEKYSYGGYTGEWWRGLSQEFNKEMGTWSSANGVNQINATDGFIQGDGFLDPSKAVDGIHFTTDGYKAVLSNIESKLNTYNSSLGSGTTGGGTEAAASDMMGVFGKMVNIGNNLVSSIFNGKDMFDTAVVDTTTTPTDGTTPDLTGISDTAEAAWKFFTAKGYSPQATAGILGNLQQESGLDPTIKQHGGGPGRGLGQWTVSEERFAGLKAHAASKGKEWTDLESQLEWIDMELAGKDPSTANILKKNYGGLEGFKKATDVNWAVEAFERAFERAGKPVWEKRKKYANDFYAKFSNAGTGFKMATQADPTGDAESQPEMMNGWAYYRQGDPQWQENINGKYMKPSGCGMTSHAMMLTGMFGKKVTPVTVGKWARANNYWNNGMSWDMPPAIAEKLGLTMVDKETNFNGLPDSSLAKVKQHLKSGYPVILSGLSNNSKDYETPFTSGGHIVFAVGVDGNDQVIINDPRGPHRTKAYSDSGILNKGIGLRGYWAFDKPDSAQLPSDWISGDFTASPGAGTDSNTAATVVTAAGDPLGVFGQMTNIGTNLVSSIFNGKDMFDVANVTDSTTSTTTTGQLPVGDTTVDEQLMLSGQEGFFKALGPSAAAAYNQYHIFPSTTLAQAALESAWGKSRVATTDKNLFGIKWTGKYAPGITVTQGLNCPGNEQGGARPYNRYQSFADSMTDHGWFLAKYDRYKPMLAASTSKEQIELLGKSGYAEASTYGSSLQKMVDKYNLTQYDTAAANTSTTPSGDAGQGDGKTYWAKGFGDNKPSKAKYSGTSGMKEAKVADASLKKARAELEQTIRKAKSSMENTTIDSRSNEKISNAVIDMLASIVCELQGINHNTAVTANGISSIEIVSANTPVSGTTNPIKARANNVNRSNSNTGYSLARQIASYK